MAIQDRELLSSLFKEGIPSKTARTKKGERLSTFSKDNNYQTSEIDITPISSRVKKFSPRRTEPNYFESHNEYQPFMDRILLSPSKKNKNKTVVYFDSEDEQGLSTRERAFSEIKRFHPDTNSLKKIYQYTGMAIADRIKKGKWHYESCKDMNYHNFDHEGDGEVEDKILKERLRATFINVRQNNRRNKLGKLLFGDKA